MEKQEKVMKKVIIQLILRILQTIRGKILIISLKKVSHLIQIRLLIDTIQKKNRILKLNHKAISSGSMTSLTIDRIPNRFMRISQQHGS